MFSSREKNYQMLIGAYKKVKSYYYYNKNFLFMRKKIAEFECDEERMEKTLRILAGILKNPSKNKEQINAWISSVDYYVLPKAFKSEKNLDSRFITNDLQKNKQINKVNLFIDMPFELHLLETVWTIFVGKFCYDKKVIDGCCYGNTLDNKNLYHQAEDIFDAISFDKNQLFKIYFGQYCNWKNNAIDTIDNNKNDKNMVMLSLDIKGYFYAIKWKFDILNSIIDEEYRKMLASLTKIIKEVYEKYTLLIADVRVLEQNVKKHESVLPIGLFSSMLLANIYLSKYDILVKSLEGVLYYGRYVDDILVVLDAGNRTIQCEDRDLDEILVNQNKILNLLDKRTYCINGFPELLIQKDKLKVFYFERGKSKSLIRQLRKTKIIPSQMNVVPDNELKMVDFEESAYAIKNFSMETKIRELGHLEINRFKLAWHMAELVRSNKNKINTLSRDEKAARQEEGEQILSFFVGSNALEYGSNWLNALYYFMLTEKTSKNAWKKFESNVRKAIKTLRIVNLEGMKGGKTNKIKAIMKRQLLEQLNICIATALAINPQFYQKESAEVKNLTYKLRKANLFNHYLLTYPLVNYLDNLNDSMNLTNIHIDDLRNINLDIKGTRKMRYTPRFIFMEELFHFAFIESVAHNKGWRFSEESISFIRQIFYGVNGINTKFAKPLQLEVHTRTENGNYDIQEINIQDYKYDLNKIRIGVANIKLGIKDCCLGIEREHVKRNRIDFLKFLKTAYAEGIQKVDFLIFPEFYLPIEWIDDVLSFVRKTGITIITGMQYVTYGDRALNTMGIFSQVRSGRYNSACMIIREKNDYAPFEKKLLALEGYRCKDHKNPIYTIVNCGQLKFGTFLCYEFTDIKARSLFKDKVDILFAPENNKDTLYFSNIIETMARDLHTFIVQANTSIYGDSRITGPYSKEQRNIVQIKGGDTDSIIIGTIDLQTVKAERERMRKELNQEIAEYINMTPKEKNKKRRSSWETEI